MGDDQGDVSRSELVIEACRRNNTELLLSVLEDFKTPEDAAELLSSAKSILGNYAYHEAALRGNYEIIDLLLDQEGFECDPVNTREGDTPLHSAVRWVNSLPDDPEQQESAIDLIEMMLEAGSDPRVRNKAHLKAFDLVDPRNTKLRSVLQEHEYIMQNATDFIDTNDISNGASSGSESD